MDDLFRGANIATSALIARPATIKTIKFATTGPARPVRVLEHLRDSIRNGQGRQRLLQLLENLRSTQTTIAHDKVYGLLGLCSVEEASGNPVRYDLEAHEAFRKSVETHARLYNDLEFLGLCTPVQRDQRPLRIPSWVPNWHSAQIRRCLGSNRVDHVAVFNAPGLMAVNFAFDGNELAVSGVPIDKIEVLGDLDTRNRQAELADPNSMLFQQYFDFWIQPAVNGDNKAYDDMKSRTEAFARTLTLHGIYLDPVPSSKEVLAIFHQWCERSKLGLQLEKLGFGSEISGKLSRKSLTRMKRLLSWQPFITNKGYIGLAREQCKLGDAVWVVAGCSVPLVLSPTDEGVANRMEVRGRLSLMVSCLAKNLWIWLQIFGKHKG